MAGTITFHAEEGRQAERYARRCGEITAQTGSIAVATPCRDASAPTLRLSAVMDVIPTSRGVDARGRQTQGRKRRTLRTRVVPPTPPTVAYERTPGAGSAPLPGAYRRHEPEKTVLHGVVRDHLETFLDRARGPEGIPREHRAFIRRISGDHPEWGEDRIAEELAAKFGIHHSASTIRRYIVRRTDGPRKTQTWRTFIQNHAKDVWACDFLTQYTAFFAVVYVLVIMEVGSRRIVHANVTTNPTLSWVKQQIREATAWDKIPRFLVHDNDGVFGQFGRPVRVEQDGKSRSYRCHLDRWLHDVIGIEGLPIPYGAPNASPHIERFMRTLREEALDHFIFLNSDHIRRVVTEFIPYYNGARPSQAIHGIPDPYPELIQPPPRTGRLVALPVLGGVQHDYRLAA